MISPTFLPLAGIRVLDPASVILSAEGAVTPRGARSRRNLGGRRVVGQAACAQQTCGGGP